MTTLNFALSRTASRDWREGDEIVCTRLDHDGNISPWLELARRQEADRALLRGRRRVPARPRPPPLAALGAYARRRVPAGRRTPSGRSHPLRRSRASPTTPARSPGSTRCTTGRTAPIDVRAAGADVLLCSPYKFYGPHLGLAYVRRELAECWRPYKVRPAPDEPVAERFETGTLAHELLAGFVAAVEYLRRRRLGVRPGARARSSGAQFLDGLPGNWPPATGSTTLDDRVPTFAIGVDDVTPRDAATRLGGARVRGVGRQLLRGRDHEAARPPRRRRARRDRPHEHRGRGRPDCSRSCPA